MFLIIRLSESSTSLWSVFLFPSESPNSLSLDLDMLPPRVVLLVCSISSTLGKGASTYDCEPFSPLSSYWLSRMKAFLTASLRNWPELCRKFWVWPGAQPAIFGWCFWKTKNLKLIHGYRLLNTYFLTEVSHHLVFLWHKALFSISYPNCS